MGDVDYGRAVRFGFFLIPQADQLPQLFRQARLAEEVGLDYLGIQDHPYQRRFLDTFTLLALLIPHTSRIRLFPDVANLPLRLPAMIAKAAVSMDLASGGRFELGLGAGGFWDAIEGMGGPRRRGSEAVQALEEALTVIRLLWSGERGLEYQGRHYGLHGIHSGPVPERQIAIWVGAYRPRMLDLIGRRADGWIPSFPYLAPERLAAAHERIDEAAGGAGRAPDTIQRLYNVTGRITDGAVAGFLDGPPAQWVEELAGLVLERGMDSFVFWPKQDPETQLRLFGEEVVPGVREAVSRRRG
jgi:alkanesulfonate monooxygenase SsuD/methylene tetrahydromethanopterin reductase-like flavin-dependent oxidoreductase (luciferase family)